MITAMPRIAIAVRDMDAAIVTFRDRLGMPVYEFDWLKKELGIRMSLCVPDGGSNVELMAPHDPARGHSQSLIRYLDRRGEGLFALMLYAPDPNAEVEEIARRGLQAMPLMKEAAGRDIHPKDTHGVLMRIYPSASAPELEREIAQSLGPASARRSDAGLTGIVRVLVAVRDVDDAIRAYRDRLGIARDVPPPVERDGARIAVCRPPSGGEIHLVTRAGSRGALGEEIARFLDDRGEGMFALVLGCDDVPQSVRELESRGLRLRRPPDDRDAWEVDPAETHGTRIRIDRRPAQKGA